jgi:hypothetical protein
MLLPLLGSAGARIAPAARICDLVIMDEARMIAIGAELAAAIRQAAEGGVDDAVIEERLEIFFEECARGLRHATGGEALLQALQQSFENSLLAA